MYKFFLIEFMVVFCLLTLKLTDLSSCAVFVIGQIKAAFLTKHKHD